MNKADIIRAWKDEEFRASLTDEERSSLPEHPSGVIELLDSELTAASGAFDTEGLVTFGCCHTGWGCTLWGCRPTGWVSSLGCCIE